MLVVDNQMNGPEPYVRRENVFEISMLSGKCLHLSYALNKLQAVFLLSWKQTSNSENADMLSDGKRYFCVSIQSAKSTNVSWVPTVCTILERGFNANLQIFKFILELKWEMKALG